MARGRVVRTRRTTRSRNLNWYGVVLETPQGLASGALASLQVVTNAQLLNHGQGAILRTRGAIYVEAQTAGQDPVCGFGIGVVDDRARAAGSTAMPQSTDLEDFLWFDVAHVGLLGATAGNGPAGYRLDIDSKAMRRFDATDTVMLIMEGYASGHNAQIYAHVDCLVKED